ncbi:MAG: MqnA/MqnD/SBP family protein [Candidatus Izemoplasmatales bacterium]
MKKILLFLLLIITLSITSCTNNSDDIKVLVPNGTPSIAQSLMEYHQDNNNYQIERVSGPAPLLAAFTSKSHEIIIAPLNLGANLYQKQSSYKLAAVVTWTNFQLISNNPIDLNNLTDKKIITYGKNATPEIIIDYLFSQIDSNISISYEASSVQESYLKFLQEEDSLAIVSEPVTTTAKESNPDLYVLDLAEVWTTYTEYELFPQAGVFVSESLTDSQIKTYLRALESSVKYTLDNPEITASNCKSLEYPFDEDIISKSITSSNIEFVYANEQIDVIYDFLEMILLNKPELIGESIPDEVFIW